MTLTEFLLARFAEDEDRAKEAICPCGGPACTPELGWLHMDEAMARLDRKRIAAHVVEWSPARVLGECEAKRRIVERHQRDRTEYPPQFDEFDPHSIKVCAECGTHRDRWSKPCPTLRDLASVYADHPDFQPEWKS